VTALNNSFHTARRRRYSNRSPARIWIRCGIAALCVSPEFAAIGARLDAFEHRGAYSYVQRSTSAQPTNSWYNQVMSAQSPIKIDPGIQGGTPCFAGTRVPVEALFDHLALNYSIDEFLEEFPTVTKRQVEFLLQMIKRDLPRHANAKSA